jgi:hypothetical protein
VDRGEAARISPRSPRAASLEECLLELTLVLRDSHEGEDVAAPRADEHPLRAAAEHDHVAAF